MTYLVGLLKEKESFLDEEYGIRVTPGALAGGISRVTVERVQPADPAKR